MKRTKSTHADLKHRYTRRMGICAVLSVGVHIAAVIVWPTFQVSANERAKPDVPLEIMDLPETRQTLRPPPPPRPAVPIETESKDVPDDVTIESTDLDFDEVSLDVPPPRATQPAVDEEILEFFRVEQRPRIVHQPTLVYPDLAKRAGIEGLVFVKFIVTKTGGVDRVQVMKGKEVFREAAIDYVRGMQFEPARQNDAPVTVWMTLPIRFQLH